MSSYRIIFSDKEMKVTMSVINKSNVLKEMINDKKTIQLKFLTKDIFVHILEMSNKLDDIADMDRKMHYIKKKIKLMNASDLFDIIRGSHYLQITNVFDLISKEFTNILENSTPSSIRSQFNIPNDFSTES